MLYRKRNDGKQFVVVDAAMNDLMRPSLYGAYHEIVPVVLRNDRAATRDVDVVGPVCETRRLLRTRPRDPPAQEGDLLAILDTGAYGMSLASNYNTRPRPAEVLVDGALATDPKARDRSRLYWHLSACSRPLPFPRP